MALSKKDCSNNSFNNASGASPTAEHFSKKLEGYYLVRSYAPDAEPYDVISDLPEELGQEIAEKNDPIRGSDNYKQRLKTESWLRESASRNGIDMTKNTPAYFAFTNNPDAVVAATSERSPHKKFIILPAHEIDLSNWTFTMDDHFFADFENVENAGVKPSHAKPHALHGRVMNAQQLVEALDKYGYPEDPYQNNFEAQMWAKEPYFLNTLKTTNDSNVQIKNDLEQ